MSWGFVGAALAMGLAGGPHCLAMCAAPCHAVVTAGQGEASTTPRPWMRHILFHGARLLGYASLGALAAWALQALAWLTQYARVLHPLWTLAHAAMLVWGLMMLAQAQQPLWVERAGRALWRRVQPLVRAPGGVAAAGFLWALMPCGLLYSALLVAALSNSALEGGLSMLAFALGSGLWLITAPWLWGRLRTQVNRWRGQWGTRLAGAALAGIAAWALWMDLVYKPSLICR